MVDAFAYIFAKGFLWSFNRNVVLAVLIGVAILLRFVGEKFNLPKWFQGVIWGLICLRMVLPAFITAPWSLVPSGSTFDAGNLRETQITLTSGIDPLDATVNDYFNSHQWNNNLMGIGLLSRILGGLCVLWMIGMAVFLFLYIRDLLHLKKRLEGARRMEHPMYTAVFVSGNIDAAFVLGLRNARIYLPEGLSDSEMNYIIMHEVKHIGRLDHIFKVILYFFLAINWYNPLVWAMYILANEDIELACDEAVVRRMEEETRKEYAKVLYTCSTREGFYPGRVLFQSATVVKRIKRIVKYRRKSVGSTIVAGGCLVVFSVFFMINPSATGAQINFQVKYPATQEYVAGQGNIKGDVQLFRFEAISEDFAIGANSEGYAVFKNPGRAWDTFVKEYADGIGLIQREYGLMPISSKQYEMYGVYGWQTHTGTPQETAEAQFVTSFLDIYENSFERP